METRKLGNTDLNLTVIGLGTWAIGGDWQYGWGAQEEKDSREAILEALESGINWIDTAPAYGTGLSEEVVGRVLKEWTSPVIIATKCGLTWDSQRKIIPCLRKKSVRRECEESLRRLGVDVIDLYQIHWPNPPAEVEEGWEALLELKASGKIRWAAVSNFSAAQLESAAQAGDVSSLQPPYSLLKRDIEKDIVQWCRNHNTGIVAYSPLQNGFLTGKVTKEWVQSLSDTDWRKKNSPFLKEPALSKLISLVEELKKYASDRGHSAGELAVSWALAKPGITAAIVGARRKGQITEVTGAADWHLSTTEVREIEEITGKYFQTGGVTS